MQNLQQRAQAMSNDALKQCLADWERRQIATGREADRLIAKDDERFVFMIDEAVQDCNRAAQIVRTLSEELAIRGAA